MKFITWVALGFLAAQNLTHAASFDCRQARTNVEKIICADQSLSRIDIEMAEIYAGATKDRNQGDALRRSQREWIRERNRCSDLDCLKSSYESRILSLRSAANASNNTTPEEPRSRYHLKMSEDDLVCLPILDEYNYDLAQNRKTLQMPTQYPWPAPSRLKLNWRSKQWDGPLSVSQRARLEKWFSVVEADVDGDGMPETVVRWAAWLRGDSRFSSLDVFDHGIELPSTKEQYDIRASQMRKVVAGLPYSFPKMKAEMVSGTLNDFDVIQLKGRHYVTGQSVTMDGNTEIREAVRWRVVSRITRTVSKGLVIQDLDQVLDSVCYFQLENLK